MKNLLIAAALFAVSLVSCQGSKSLGSMSTKDSVAYAIAIDFGTWARQMDSTLNVSVIQQGIADAMKDKAQIKSQDARAFLNEWFGVRVPAQNLAEGKAWLEEVKAGNSAVQATQSGLLYEIISEGDAATKPVNDADSVVASYKGMLKNGTVFDQNDSIPFALNGVIRGWTEGLKLIGKGGKINLWIPSELGYGPQPMGQIPANSALKFEVELIDVTPAPIQETPAQ